MNEKLLLLKSWLERVMHLNRRILQNSNLPAAPAFIIRQLVDHHLLQQVESVPTRHTSPDSNWKVNKFRALAQTYIFLGFELKES